MTSIGMRKFCEINDSVILLYVFSEKKIQTHP